MKTKIRGIEEMAIEYRFTKEFLFWFKMIIIILNIGIFAVLVTAFLNSFNEEEYTATEKVCEENQDYLGGQRIERDYFNLSDDKYYFDYSQNIAVSLGYEEGYYVLTKGNRTFFDVDFFGIETTCNEEPREELELEKIYSQKRKSSDQLGQVGEYLNKLCIEDFNGTFSYNDTSWNCYTKDKISSSDLTESWLNENAELIEIRCIDDEYEAIINLKDVVLCDENIKKIWKLNNYTIIQ